MDRKVSAVAVQVFFRLESDDFRCSPVFNPLVPTPLIIRLDTSLPRRMQMLSACVCGRVELCFGCFVEPLDLPVRPQVMRRESGFPISSFRR
jgi:hypothetical protein